MIISFSPQGRDDTLTLEKSSGDRLRINGELFNFNPLEEGGTIPVGEIPCDWIIGPVDRIDGEIHIMVILPHGPNPEPWQAFPAPMEVSEDGPIDIPVDTVVEHTEEPAEGGFNDVTTTYRWGREPEIETVFVPDPEPDPVTAEEIADVDA